MKTYTKGIINRNRICEVSNDLCCVCRYFIQEPIELNVRFQCWSTRKKGSVKNFVFTLKKIIINFILTNCTRWLKKNS